LGVWRRSHFHPRATSESPVQVATDGAARMLIGCAEYEYIECEIRFGLETASSTNSSPRRIPINNLADLDSRDFGSPLRPCQDCLAITIRRLPGLALHH
jgi:hypothetical protein